MKEMHIIGRPAKASDMSSDDFYNEISHDWQLKAERLQARRWRALMRAVKHKGNTQLI